MGTSIDWHTVGLVAIPIAMVFGLLVATFFVVREIIRHQRLSVLGCFIVLIWGGAIYVGLHKDDVAQPSAPQTSSSSPEKTAGELFPSEVAKMVVLRRLRDPGSAEFGRVNVYGDRKLKGKAVRVACGSVNAKNGFGGYTGFTDFLVIDEGYRLFMNGGDDNSVFVSLWNGLCAGKHS